MTQFPSSKFTYGFEMEMGDVRRDLVIPAHLGQWEHSECDIVNMREPYRGVCADPMGIDPPVGGEVNTVPTRSRTDQVMKIQEIVGFFTDAGCPPTSPFTTHNHCHVHVPGLIDDAEALRRLIKYVGENQHDFVESVYGFYEMPQMKECAAAKNYLKLDGGRFIPDWRVENIYNHTVDFASFIKQHYTAKDGKTLVRPIRTAINTYCLKHVKTIEFRCFRGSFDPVHLDSCFHACELFVDAAVNGGPSWRELRNSVEFPFEFPPMTFDLELAQGWVATKKNVVDIRGKNRQFIEVA